VATVVQQTGDRKITAPLVNQIAAELLGIQLNLADTEVSEALDPRTNVEVRATCGGPAPAEVLRMVEARCKQLEEGRGRQGQQLAALREADQRLRAAASALAASGG
jgi:argininosuccinate lyase